MKIFRPKIISTFKNYNSIKFANDVVAGVIVAIIALPLSIALAIASGAQPVQGLYTAIVAGFVIALLGGSNVNISGPTAAFATIVAGVIAKNGFSGLIIATIMAGLILIIMGLCRMGSLIRFIPHNITVGFTSGIAVTILIGQIKDFLGLKFSAGANPVEASEKVVEICKSIGTIDWKTIVIGVIGLVILIAWPLIGKAVKGKASLIFVKIPPSIIAVVIGIFIVMFSPLKADTIGSRYVIEGGFPKFNFPAFSWETVINVLPDAFTIAILAAIESLLSCVVSDGMIGDKHNSNTELIAQGAGNICSGLFGGIPATGAIARTAANVKNGGRSPISGMVHAVVLLLVLLVLMPYAGLIPMPIIAAILFMVAYNMSEWKEFLKICKTSDVGSIIVLVITFALTIVFNLVIAIAIGLVLSVLFNLAKKIKSKSK